MQYLLIICHDDAFAPTEILVREIGAWVRDMEGHGVLMHGNPLRPPGEATTVRVREGKVVRTDGPFAQSREKMAAYGLIECASLEQAIDVASRHPMARAATIEVRPVWADPARQATPS
ncbi:YciI family protein [Polaromonas sp. P1-6]|nr:YciI family protein [Polaromonas sp. P1-6]